MTLLKPDERAMMERLLLLHAEYRRRHPWVPHPDNHPQQMAYESTAHVIGFGGAAGGGKTDLAVGLALTQHSRSIIFRREGTTLGAIVDRIEEVLGTREGLNASPPMVWRTKVGKRKRLIDFGSAPNVGDEQRHKGRPHDLIAFDEAELFTEGQVRFLMTWNRTTDGTQRCRTLLTFNPPSSAEGRWIIGFFAAWIDPKHHNPAKPGEIRWYAQVEGVEVERENGDTFVHEGETIVPRSRTFIPSRVTDNPYLMGTGYLATLQALPEPLRSQMLNGDFAAAMGDDPMQLIPTQWVLAAQARWTQPNVMAPMDSIGVDVARGGKDQTVIARRHGMWYDKPLVYPGMDTPNGPVVAGLVIAARRDNAPIHLDAIGVGSSPADFLTEMEQQVVKVIVSEASGRTDKSGRLRFSNLRSDHWWRMRELLDPEANNGIALPPDPKLLAELCAPRWSVRGIVIHIESRDEIIKRVGRSPDYAAAYILASLDTPRNDIVDMIRQAGARKGGRREYDPLANLGGQP